MCDDTQCGVILFRETDKESLFNRSLEDAGCKMTKANLLLAQSTPGQIPNGNGKHVRVSTYNSVNGIAMKNTIILNTIVPPSVLLSFCPCIPPFLFWLYLLCKVSAVFWCKCLPVAFAHLL